MARPKRTRAFPARRAEPLTERATAWAEAFAATPIVKWDVIGGHTLIVDDFEASGNVVRFWARIKRADGTVVYEDDHFVVNPPADDVMGAVRSIVEGFLT